MIKGIFISEEEKLGFDSELASIKALLETLVRSMKAPQTESVTMLTRRAASYYISTGRFPDDIDNPPTRGLTRFDVMVNSGQIKCIPSGERRKLFRVSDLDQFLFRYSS